MAINVGALPVASIILATVAIILGTHGIISCQTVKFPSSSGGSIEAGLFGYETYGIVGVSDSGTVWVVDYCLPYTDIEDEFGFSYTYDFSTLQKIAITIPILGGIALIGSCIFVCIPLPSVVWKFFGLLYLVTCILQGVSLKVVNSSVCTNNPLMQYLNKTSPAMSATFTTNQCVWGSGFRECISAVVFWGLAAIICLAMPAPPPDDDDLPATGKPPSETFEQGGED